MKKKIIKICNLVDVILVIAFVVKSIFDYVHYNPIATSAPYYVNILVNAIYFLLPALLIFVLSLVLKKSIKR